MPALNLNKIKEFKLYKSKKETIIFVIAGFVLVIIIYFQIFLKGQISGLFKTMAEVRNLKADIKNIEQDIAYEDILKKRLKSMEDKINIYEKKLPSEQDIPMLLGELSNMAKDSYVKILGISPLNVTRKEEGAKLSKIYNEIPIMVSAKSGYHELGAFINKLENADRFMEVSDIKIKADKSDSRRHDVELIVSTYVLVK